MAQPINKILTAKQLQNLLRRHIQTQQKTHLKVNEMVTRQQHTDSGGFRRSCDEKPSKECELCRRGPIRKCEISPSCNPYGFLKQCCPIRCPPACPKNQFSCPRTCDTLKAGKTGSDALKRKFHTSTQQYGGCADKSDKKCKMNVEQLIPKDPPLHPPDRAPYGSKRWRREANAHNVCPEDQKCRPSFKHMRCSQSIDAANRRLDGEEQARRAEYERDAAINECACAVQSCHADKDYIKSCKELLNKACVKEKHQCHGCQVYRRQDEQDIAKLGQELVDRVNTVASLPLVATDGTVHQVLTKGTKCETLGPDATLKVTLHDKCGTREELCHKISACGPLPHMPPCDSAAGHQTKIVCLGKSDPANCAFRDALYTNSCSHVPPTFVVLHDEPARAQPSQRTRCAPTKSKASCAAIDSKTFGKECKLPTFENTEPCIEPPFKSQLEHRYDRNKCVENASIVRMDKEVPNVPKAKHKCAKGSKEKNNKGNKSKKKPNCDSVMAHPKPPKDCNCNKSPKRKFHSSASHNSKDTKDVEHIFDTTLPKFANLNEDVTVIAEPNLTRFSSSETNIDYLKRKEKLATRTNVRADGDDARTPKNTAVDVKWKRVLEDILKSYECQYPDNLTNTFRMVANKYCDRKNLNVSGNVELTQSLVHSHELPVIIMYPIHELTHNPRFGKSYTQKVSLSLARLLTDDEQKLVAIDREYKRLIDESESRIKDGHHENFNKKTTGIFQSLKNFVFKTILR